MIELNEIFKSSEKVNVEVKAVCQIAFRRHIPPLRIRSVEL